MYIPDISIRIAKSYQRSEHKAEIEAFIDDLLTQEKKYNLKPAVDVLETEG